MLFHLPELSCLNIYMTHSLPSLKTLHVTFRSHQTNQAKIIARLEYDLHQGCKGKHHRPPPPKMFMP